ncbi:MAG: dockerin type I repeat-containing protein [Armatimonadota bacterium]
MKTGTAVLHACVLALLFGAVLLTSIPASAQGHLGILNGDFSTGDITGWRMDGIQGGLVWVVRQGMVISGLPGSDAIPYPEGTKWAVAVRSSASAPVSSIGILTSEPFIPNAPTLSFMYLSESSRTAPSLLVLKPDADPVKPAPEDILMEVEVENLNPGTGETASFTEQQVDISQFYNASDPLRGTPIKIQFRQHTTAAGAGYATLFTNIKAGEFKPLVVPPPPEMWLGIRNPVFLNDSLDGWKADSINDGIVWIVRRGLYFLQTGANDIPIPTTWAVMLRSNLAGNTNSEAILTSEPFIPNAPTLSFRVLSQHANVAGTVNILKPEANLVSPSASDILLSVPITNEKPGTGATARFATQEIDISRFYNAAEPPKGTPIRVQFRQHTTEEGMGYFTLITAVNAGEAMPVSQWKPPVVKGDVSGDGKVSISDATIALQLAVGLVKPTSEQLAGADLDGDGRVSIAEVTQILRAAVGLTTLQST